MLHSQILDQCIVRSVSPQIEDNDALKCSSDNFPNFRNNVVFSNMINTIEVSNSRKTSGVFTPYTQ